MVRERYDGGMRAVTRSSLVLWMLGGCAAAPTAPSVEPSDQPSVLATVGVVPEPSSSWTIVVEPYSGKYSTDREFSGRVKFVEELLPECLSDASGRMEWRREMGSKVQVRFRDWSQSSNRNSGAMFTDCDCRVDGCYPVVVVATEALMRSSLADVRRGVLHESFHCVTNYLHPCGSAQVPRWIEEGAAILHDDSGETVLRWWLESELARGEELLPLVAREHERLIDGSCSHAYAYLAVRRLRERFGADLPRSLLSSPDWEEVITTACGQSPPSVLADVREHATKELQRRLSFRDEYLLGRRAYEEGRLSEARELLSGYVRRHPQDAFVTRARLLVGIAACKMFDWTAADSAFEQSREFDPDSRVETDLALWSFYATRKGGKVEKAREIGEALLRDFPFLPDEDRDKVRSALSRLPK